MLPVDLVAFAAAAEWRYLPPNIAALRFAATATDPRFPGALLPRVRQDRSVVWYAAAPTAHAWRRLRPLLLAYVGPTVTTFFGLPTELDTSDPAEKALSRSGVFSAAILVPAGGGADFAARGLARLIDAVARAPNDSPPPSPSTSTLLALLDMDLAAGDRAGTNSCSAILRNEWRLDVVNCRFVEVRIAAAFREWQRLVLEPWFDDLCRVPKPPFIARALLEALWHVHLEPFADDAAKLRQRYVGYVRAACVDLLREVPTPHTGAAASLIALDTQVGGTAPGGESIADQPTRGWRCWVASAASGQMRDAASAARMAAAEQPASLVTANSAAEALAAQLQSMALSQNARAFLVAALPELVRWLVEDPDYPRSVMRPLYDAALTIFTLLEERGGAARAAMLEVLDALLSLAPGPIEYRTYLQDAGTFVVGEAGTSTAYWLIDLAERLLRNPASDGSARLAVECNSQFAAAGNQPTHECAARCLWPGRGYGSMAADCSLT